MNDDFETHPVGTGAKLERYEAALRDAAAWLRNDMFKTRVKNALSIIDEALAEGK